MVAAEVIPHCYTTRELRQRRQELEARTLIREEYIIERQDAQITENLRVSRDWHGVGGADPSIDFDLVALIVEHHDYPDADMLGHYTTEV
jgi:hypothetical protein